ncbi:MAG TPA: hypothetical protein VGX96_21180 [Candidatus Elarobacter sp.]|jgi:hypothetical protein|nr:hypothetical protein [Candidatus Elarobacter sp.]
MYFLKRLAAASAAAILTLAVAQPAAAVVVRQYFVQSSTLHVAGGSINCSSGCTVTVTDDGYTEISVNGGETYLSDGTNLYGAP